MEKKIADQEIVLNIVKNPSFDIVDKLAENIALNNEEEPAYRSARRLIKNVMDTYHKDVDVTTVDPESLINNCAQRGGVILNMFRDPLAKNSNYSEANISEFKLIEKPAEGEKEGKGEKE